MYTVTKCGEFIAVIVKKGKGSSILIASFSMLDSKGEKKSKKSINQEMAYDLVFVKKLPTSIVKQLMTQTAKMFGLV